MNFDTINLKKPKRSLKDLSHSLIATMNIGELDPVYWADLVPNDVVEIDISALSKFAPMVAPAYSRMIMRIDTFFVPINQIDHNFYSMIMNTKLESKTLVENGERTTSNITSPLYITPHDFSMRMGRKTYTTSNPPDYSYFTLSGDWTYENRKAVGRLSHFLGLPKPLCTPVFKDDGTLSSEIMALSNFYPFFDTSGGSAWSNKTDTVMQCTSDSVTRICLNPWRAYQHIWNEYYRDSMTCEKVDLYPDLSGLVTNNFHSGIDNYRFLNNVMSIRYISYKKDIFNTASTDPTLGAESLALPSTVTGLRKTNKLESFLEKRALTGDRISDWILSHFGTTPSDYELDRPIFLGRSSSYVNISETLQTSESTQESPQGNRSGNANNLTDSKKITFRSPDYGILMVLCSVQPEQSYYNGIARKMVKDNWESYLTPEFATIGLQDIRQSEIKFIYGSSMNANQETFGYSPRYSEFAHENNRVLGDFCTSLNFWHQAVDYCKTIGNGRLQQSRYIGTVGMKDSLHLGTPYVADGSESYNRIFAVVSDHLTDHIQTSFYFNIKKLTSLPSSDMPHL